MAAIGQLTFPSGVDQYLALGQEELVRKLTIGNSWNSIRITLHLAFDGHTAANIGYCHLYAGVCSGTVQTLASGNPLNYVGIGFHNTSSDNYIYTANSGNPYWETNGNAVYYKSGGALTLSQIGGNGSSIPEAGQGTILRRGAVACVITKGASTYTVQHLYTTSYRSADLTTAAFIDLVEQVVNTPSVFTSTQATPAISEAYGPLDTLSIMWNRGVYPIHLYAIGVTRLS